MKNVSMPSRNRLAFWQAVLLWKRFPERWVAGHIGMWNKLCSLHSDQKIRYGRKLDTVDPLQQIPYILQAGAVQQQRSGPVQGCVSENLEFLPWQVRKYANRNG